MQPQDAAGGADATRPHYGPWAQVSSKAVYDTRLSSPALRILCALTTHQDANHECYPRQGALAHALGVTQGAIAKCVKELVTLGYIEVRFFKDVGDERPRNHYRILPDQAPRLKERQHAAERAAQTRSDIPPSNITPSNITPGNANRTDPISRTEPVGRTASHVANSFFSIPIHAPQAPASPPTSAQAPAARVGGCDQTAFRRDPLTLALIACLGYEPATRREWGQWHIAIKDLRNIGATAEDIPRAIRGYQATYPHSRVTPLALVGHWAEIQKGKPHELAQLEINRRAAAADDHLRAERERADAERRAQEKREVELLLAEYGYADGR